MLLKIPPALLHRRFRLLWAGMAISIAGSQMQTWSLFWHIRELTDQPIYLGGIGLARILPILFFSLIGGAVADVANRRRVMFVTQSLMALTAAGLAYFTLQGTITIWHIYALTAIQAMCVSFDTPARQALIPNLLPPRDLPNAFSMNSIAQQTGSIVGPALSGLVIAYFGQSYTYIFNALSFMAVIVSLILMGRVEQVASNHPARIVSLSGIREGIAFILASPVILSTMVLDFVATFFSSANTLMPIIARDILHVGAVEYGWLSAAQSLGAVSAALVISQMAQLRRQGPIFLGSILIFGASTILLGFARTFSLAMLALILIGASDSVSTIIRNTIRQLQTPDHIRGRMVSINQIFFMGGPQLGEVEAGVVAQFFGAPTAIVSGGFGCILAVLWISRRWPQLRRYNTADTYLPAG